MFIATLVGIFKFEEIPQQYGPFVRYKASVENKTIDETEEIAILNISGTQSHHVLFLNSYKNIEEIKEELKQADAKLNYNTKKILEGHL
ncbi:MAG: DUF749 domain-containing protein [Methanobacterium sp.]|uniref:DUF749 domain-containing protein n=1 Tax=Methanobacterium sp. TaxID=2164 RepID=UPI003D65932B|nr:DUF749 domain-containing protein [Methanobacterium sp.]